MSVQSPITIRYPETDGKPMAETPVHRDEMIYLIKALQQVFQDNPLVYVSGNMLLYYEQGNPRRRVSPDVMAIRGIDKRERRVYLLWEEGKGPDVIIEVTSKGTKSKDEGTKKKLYERVLRVKEYYLYDPLQEYIKEGLRAYHLVAGQYEEMPWIEPGRYWSQELGVELRLEGERIRVYDPATERVLLRHEELEEAHQMAREQAVREQKRAAEAERRAARLKAELERLKAELARRSSEERDS